MRNNLTIQLFYQLSGLLKPFALSTGISPKRGRKPKIPDWEIAAAFIVCYLTYTPVLKFLQMNIDSSLRSWHIFRKSRIVRVYRLLRFYLIFNAVRRAILLFLLCSKSRLIVDGTILPLANVSRARTHRIKRFGGKEFWVKRKRKLYSHHYHKQIEFEELYYGVLVIFLCDEDGIIYDIWFTSGNRHEIRALRERKERSIWTEWLLNTFEVLGDKGYRGMKEVKVTDRKELKRARQIVESLIGGTKGFDYSRWRKGITLLAYLHGFALGFSYLREVNRHLAA